MGSRLAQGALCHGMSQRLTGAHHTTVPLSLHLCEAFLSRPVKEIGLPAPECGRT
jgi:hypothetical protein